jgi:hypothetical protein
MQGRAREQRAQGKTRHINVEQGTARDIKEEQRKAMENK